MVSKVWISWSSSVAWTFSSPLIIKVIWSPLAKAWWVNSKVLIDVSGAVGGDFSRVMARLLSVVFVALVSVNRPLFTAVSVMFSIFSVISWASSVSSVSRFWSSRVTWALSSVPIVKVIWSPLFKGRSVKSKVLTVVKGSVFADLWRVTTRSLSAVLLVLVSVNTPLLAAASAIPSSVSIASWAIPVRKWFIFWWTSVPCILLLPPSVIVRWSPSFNCCGVKSTVWTVVDKGLMFEPSTVNATS